MGSPGVRDFWRICWCTQHYDILFRDRLNCDSLNPEDGLECLTVWEGPGSCSFTGLRVKRNRQIGDTELDLVAYRRQLQPPTLHWLWIVSNCQGGLAADARGLHKSSNVLHLLGRKWGCVGPFGQMITIIHLRYRKSKCDISKFSSAECHISGEKPCDLDLSGNGRAIGWVSL